MRVRKSACVALLPWNRAWGGRALPPFSLSGAEAEPRGGLRPFVNSLPWTCGERKGAEGEWGLPGLQGLSAGGDPFRGAVARELWCPPQIVALSFKISGEGDGAGWSGAALGDSGKAAGAAPGWEPGPCGSLSGPWAPRDAPQSRRASACACGKES